MGWELGDAFAAGNGGDDRDVGGGGHARGKAAGVADGQFGGQTGVGAHFAEGFAVHEFHDDVEFAGSFTDFVDGADVGMSESGGSASLREKILAAGGIETGVFSSPL